MEHAVGLVAFLIVVLLMILLPAIYLWKQLQDFTGKGGTT